MVEETSRSAAAERSEKSTAANNAKATESFSSSSSLANAFSPPPVILSPPTVDSEGEGLQHKSGQYRNQGVDATNGADTPTPNKQGGIKRIEINGQHVPAAIANAFGNPSESRRPFSYFTGGFAPDLSEKPTPSSLRKSNPASPINLLPSPVPRILPAVNNPPPVQPKFQLNNPYPYPQQQQQQQQQMPFTHIQYNDPINLYSNDAANEAYYQATGAAPPPGGVRRDLPQSGTQRYVQEQDRGVPLPAQHPAFLEEPKGDYPNYKGYVDPRAQSPMFKRLQQSTGAGGLDSGTETEGEYGESRHYTPATRLPLHVETQNGDLNPSPQFHRLQRATGTGLASDFGSVPAELHGPAQSQVYSPYSNEPRLDWQKKANEAQNRWAHSNIPSQYDADSDAEYVETPAWQLKPSVTKGTEAQHAAARNLQRLSSATPSPVSWGSPTPHETVPSYVRHDKDDSQTDGLNPAFAAHVAEAERPHVPPKHVPDWVNAALRKTHGWERISEEMEQEKQRLRPVARTTQEEPWSMPSHHKDRWQHHYADHHLEQGATMQQRLQHQHQLPYYKRNPRSRSQDAPRSRKALPAEKEPWLKPYVAPNVGPIRGSRGPLPSLSRSSSAVGSRSVSSREVSVAGPPLTFGLHYGPARSPSRQRLTYQRPLERSYSRSKYDDSLANRNSSSSYSTLTASHGKFVPSWQQPSGQSDAPFSKQFTTTRNVWETQRDAYGSNPGGGSSTFQYESEAERQRRYMEEEMQRRAAAAPPAASQSLVGAPQGWRPMGGGASTTVSSVSRPPWRPSTGGISPAPSSAVTQYYSAPTGGSAVVPAAPRWQSAPGANTKAVATGSYLDPEGNKVSYTKESYTTSDPGKEFSMLTEEEKRVLEQPLEPGVLSRHVTTKYYKKSTYTSNTTTSTTPTGPIASLPSMQPLSIEDRPQPGSVGPGVTQF